MKKYQAREQNIKPFLIRLPEKLVRTLDRKAKREGVTRALLIRTFLESALVPK
jgi:metal-responsive CopG/Arc/MetJ family transcriptional regulator